MDESVHYELNAAYVCAALKTLGIPVDVDSKRSRLAMQKAIYLDQAGGFELGYRFMWLSNGPYCQQLSNDYHLASSEWDTYRHADGDDDFKSSFGPVEAVIAAKPPVANSYDWLEAVASLDFMVRVMGRSVEHSIECCKRWKPELSALFDHACQHVH